MPFFSSVKAEAQTQKFIDWSGTNAGSFDLLQPGGFIEISEFNIVPTSFTLTDLSFYISSITGNPNDTVTAFVQTTSYSLGVYGGGDCLVNSASLNTNTMANGTWVNFRFMNPFFLIGGIVYQFGIEAKTTIGETENYVSIGVTNASSLKFLSTSPPEFSSTLSNYLQMIAYGYSTSEYPPVYLNVHVVDMNNKPVEHVTLTANWTLPSNATTDENGWIAAPVVNPLLQPSTVQLSAAILGVASNLENYQMTTDTNLTATITLSLFNLDVYVTCDAGTAVPGTTLQLASYSYSISTTAEYYNSSYALGEFPQVPSGDADLTATYEGLNFETVLLISSNSIADVKFAGSVGVNASPSPSSSLTSSPSPPASLSLTSSSPSQPIKNIPEPWLYGIIVALVVIIVAMAIGMVAKWKKTKL